VYFRNGIYTHQLCSGFTMVEILLSQPLFWFFLLMIDYPMWITNTIYWRRLQYRRWFSDMSAQLQISAINLGYQRSTSDISAQLQISALNFRYQRSFPYFFKNNPILSLTFIVFDKNIKVRIILLTLCGQITCPSHNI